MGKAASLALQMLEEVEGAIGPALWRAEARGWVSMARGQWKLLKDCTFLVRDLGPDSLRGVCHPGTRRLPALGGAAHGRGLAGPLFATLLHTH